LLDGFLLHLSKPSALLISEGNIKKERKSLKVDRPHIFASYLYCFSERLFVWSPVEM
jgi:hypothetical protein